MTAHLVVVPPQLQSPVCSRSTSKSSKRGLEETTSFVRPSERSTTAETKYLEADTPSENLGSDTLWSRLVESMPEGVIVVAQTLQPLYTSLKAKRLCQQLSSEVVHGAVLLDVVIEACHRLIKAESETRSLIAEYQGLQGHSVRVRASWLSMGAISSNSKSDQPYMLVLLEDCDEALKENLWVDRQKYDLTGREAEIWTLLRQEYTYQEIADILQISLNTVKTHVKNVYTKRRSVVGEGRIWYSK